VTTPRILTGVLRGFLGSYVSRNSDFHGYWLFGLLVTDLRRMEIDLLSVPDSAMVLTPDEAARVLAAAKFLDQLTKVGFSVTRLASATLVLERLAQVTALAGCYARPGFNVLFRASVTADTGRVFTSEDVVFVAPHDPRFEQRSTRA
jgi:hypothetical protein